VESLSVDGRCQSVCLSVCLSVPCLAIRWEWKGVGSWKLAGKRHMIRMTRDPIYRSNGQRSRSPGSLTPWPKIGHIFRMGRPTNFKHGIRMTCITDMRSDHQAESSGWLFKSSHHLQGAGAYYGGNTTGSTASLYYRCYYNIEDTGVNSSNI